MTLWEPTSCSAQGPTPSVLEFGVSVVRSKVWHVGFVGL